jgi:hypothetical protein
MEVCYFGWMAEFVFFPFPSFILFHFLSNSIQTHRFACREGRRKRRGGRMFEKLGTAERMALTSKCPLPVDESRKWHGGEGKRRK